LDSASASAARGGEEDAQRSASAAAAAATAGPRASDAPGLGCLPGLDAGFEGLTGRDGARRAAALLASAGSSPSATRLRLASPGPSAAAAARFAAARVSRGPAAGAAFSLSAIVGLVSGGGRGTRTRRRGPLARVSVQVCLGWTGKCRNGEQIETVK